MRRIITLTAIALGLTSGLALADRQHGGNRGGGRNLGNRSGGVVVRDHRGGSVDANRGGWNRGSDNRGSRGSVDRGSFDRGSVDRGSFNRGSFDRDRGRAVVTRRPVFASSGRFNFGGDTWRSYHRPVINVRYRNYYQRPTLLVENYDAMDGYIWISGQWQWTGYEWIWAAGHYDVDPAYSQGYGDNDDDDGYDGY